MVPIWMLFFFLIVLGLQLWFLIWFITSIVTLKTNTKAIADVLLRQERAGLGLPPDDDPPDPNTSIRTLRYCPEGHKIKPGQSFCPECGQAPGPRTLPRPDETSQGAAEPTGTPTANLNKWRVCTKGHDIEPGQKFCAQCGSPPE